MIQEDPALLELARAITAAVESEDLDRISDFLRGRCLPALGDTVTPAEMLQRALEEISDPDVLRKLARLLGGLIEGLTAQESSPLDAKRRAALMNAVRLAAELPAEAPLASALRYLLTLLEARERSAVDISEFELAVYRALVYQQVDRSSEMEWLSILWGLDRDEIQWTSARRTLLLTAWRGLLWIPPATELLDAGEVLDTTRIEQGLIAFHRAVSGHKEGSDLVRLALAILADTYPRSVEFWEALFRPFFSDWPIEFQQAVAAKWPGLGSHLEDRKAALVWLSRTPMDDNSRPSLPPTSRLPCLTAGLQDSRWYHFPALFSPGASWQKGLRVKEIAKVRHSLQNFLACEDNGFSASMESHAVRSDLHFAFGSHLSHVFVEPICLFNLSSCSVFREGEVHAMSFFDILEPKDVRSDCDDFLAKSSHLWSKELPNAIEHLSYLEMAKVQENDLSRELASYVHSMHRQLCGVSDRLLLPAGEALSVPQETILQRKGIPLACDLDMSISLSLACRVPLPLPYLKNLYALNSGDRDLAISQLRRLRLRAWNPLERSYLGAILTLAALKENDFDRALQELERQTLWRTLPPIEYRVLELHAHAGAGQWQPSEHLFRGLTLDPLLHGAAKETLQLLDDAFGFSGTPSLRPADLHERIIESEADMLAAAGVS